MACIIGLAPRSFTSERASPHDRASSVTYVTAPGPDRLKLRCLSLRYPSEAPRRRDPALHAIPPIDSAMP